MMNLSTVLILSTLVSLFSTASAQYRCSLCASAGQLPVRWDYRFSNGLTCRDYYVNTANLGLYDATCSANRGVAQATCCNAATPAVASAATTSSTPGAYSGPTGAEPVCNICRDGSYPGIPYGFIVARYVGEYTCDQFYGRGLHGMIPMYMCGPLQDFAYSVCGCGIYNPSNQAATVSYSLTSNSGTGASLYSGTPGGRNLRGGAGSEASENKNVPSPEDFHFETRELPADFFASETSEVSEAQVEEHEASDASEPAAETQAEDVQQ